MTLVGMSREQIEAHLDAGELECEMYKSRWWVCRRNGRTKTWKRDPDRYEIPIKAGFKDCGILSEASLRYFRVRGEQK